MKEQAHELNLSDKEKNNLVNSSVAKYKEIAENLTQEGKLQEAVLYYCKAISENATKDTIQQSSIVNYFKNNIGQNSQLMNNQSSQGNEPMNNNNLVWNNPLPNIYAPENLSNTNNQNNAQLAQPNVYLQQAENYFNQKQWQQSTIACQQALQIDPQSTEAYKILGNTLHQMGKINEAISCYMKALEINPNFPEVYANLGTIYAKQKQWQQALNYYQQAINLNPKFAGVYLNLGKVLQQLGQPDKALEYTYQGLTLEPEKATHQAHFNLGQELFKKGEISKALSCYRQAIKINPNFVEGYQKLAEILAQQGEWKESSVYYRKAMEIQTQTNIPSQNLANNSAPTNKTQNIPITNIPLPNLPNQIIPQANIPTTNPLSQDLSIQPTINPTTPQLFGNSIDSKQLMPAPSIVHSPNPPSPISTQHAIKSSPNSAEDFANVGNVYAQKQQWQEAIACYQKAINRNPQFAGAYRNLARIYDQMGKPQESAEHFYQAFTLEPTWAKPDVHFNLGNTLMEYGKVQLAVECYKRAIQTKPDFTEAYLKLGAIYSEKGYPDEAIKCYHQGIINNPQQGNLYEKLAEILVSKEQIDAAINTYQQAAQLQKDNWKPYHILGDLLSKQQRLDEAINAYYQAIELNPDFSWSYNNLGDALIKLKRWEEATKAFQKAIELKPDFVWSHYNLGDALIEQELIDQAIFAYTQALQIQPNLTKAEEKLNSVLLARVKKDLETASFYYHQAIDDNPQDIESYYELLEIESNNLELHLQLGKNLIATGRIKEAIACYQEIIIEAPELNTVYWQLTDLLRQIGEEEKAAKYWYIALKKEPEKATAQEYLQLGQILQQQEKLEEAVYCYHQVITKEPKIPLSYSYLGEIYRQKKHWKKAGKIYKDALQKCGDHQEFWYYLGEMVSKEKQWKQALKFYHKAIQLQETYWQAHYQKGLVLAELEEWDKAINSYQTALNLKGDLVECYYHLGTAQSALKKWEEAINSYQKVVKLQSHFWETQDKEFPPQFINFLQQIANDAATSLFPIILSAARNLKLASLPAFRESCRQLVQHLTTPKIPLTKAFWLTPSIFYLEYQVKDIWIKDKATVLLVSEHNCAVAQSYFFQIAEKEVAGIIVFSHHAYRKVRDAHFLTVFYNETPLLLEGDCSDKAYNLQFINRINGKTEYQKNLIRETISQAIINLTPPHLYEEAGGLLHKLQHFINIAPVVLSDHNLPFAIFIDYVIPVKCYGVFISGWLHDPYQMLEEIELLSDLGFTLTCREQIYHYNRQDVNEYLQDKRYGNFEQKVGFCAYVKVPDELSQKLENLAQLHSFRFHFKLKGGITYNMTPAIKYRDAYADRKLVMSIAPVSEVSDAMLENCIGLAAYQLQKLCMEQVKIKEVKVIGTPVVNPLVSIIIPLYKRLDFMKVQFPTMGNDPTIKQQCEIIYVLDSPEQEKEVKDFLLNNSTLYELPVTLVIMERNSGYSAANNTGVSQAKGNYLVLMNSDVFPKTKGWAIKMADFYASNPKIATLAPKLLYEDQSVQHAGMFYEKNIYPFWLILHYYKGFPNSYASVNMSRQVPAVTGACLMIKRELYEEVGGLSTSYIIGDFEDSDLCLKCTELGYESWYYAEAELYHLERQSVPLNNVYSSSLAWQYNGRLHTNRWNHLIQKLQANS